MGGQRERMKDAFDRARRLSKSERGAFLDGLADVDAAMRSQIEDMLGALDEASGFMREPTRETIGTNATFGAGSQEAALREGPGTLIGPFKVLQLIGEGGFGSVFMAEQEKPVSRRVALKIIKLGMDTRQVVARFEQERQALAMMDHPNIAKVLDAGATETGRPYFVMELVKGDPIVEYCDRNSLGIRERLELFAQVCSAVQHAHTKGIIHRDIKPSNVLVSTQDGKPFAKVIDFGIAKATSSRLTEKTLFTEHRQLIGTPEYMSPEQAEGSLDIDTRTDVYSLGVLLYELLTGSTPFGGTALRSAAYAEIQRIIREVEPPCPSTRLSQASETIAAVAAKRNTEPRKLGILVRGELDWIVMKALEKDRQRRYETANGLAMDIRRYLSGEAVVAAPPSTAYRIRKFVHRHRAGVATAGVIACVLILGVVGTSWGFVQASHQRNVAIKAEQSAREEADRATKAEQRERHRSDELEQVARFQAEQLGSIDASMMGIGLQNGLIVKVREAALRAHPDQDAARARAEEVQRLVAGADFTGLAFDSLEDQFIKPSLAAINRDFEKQPLVRARLLQSLADAALDIGINRSMTDAHREALEIRRRMLGDDDPATIESIRTAAWLEMKASHLDVAERLFREALERSGRVMGEDSRKYVECLSTLAIILQKQARDEDARRLRERAYELARKNLGEDDGKTLDIKIGLAISLLNDGKYEMAEAMFREVLDVTTRTHSPDDNAAAAPLAWLSICLMNEGRTEEAEPLARRATELNRLNLGSDHPTTLSQLNTLGWLHRKMRRFDEAERELTEAYERRRRLVGDDHQDTLCTLRNLGQLALEEGQVEKAEELSRRAFDALRKTLGNAHMDTIWAQTNLARSLTELGRCDEAETLFREVAAAGPDFPGLMSIPLVKAIISLSERFAERGQFDRATRLLRDMDDRLLTSTSLAANGEERTRQLRRMFIDSLVRTFEAWHVAEPGKGHDARAAEWAAKRDAPSSP